MDTQLLRYSTLPPIPCAQRHSFGRTSRTSATVGVFSDTRVRFPALNVTMAPKEPQPRAEGVSLSRAMARQGG
jgi:hypothetical protein